MNQPSDDFVWPPRQTLGETLTAEIATTSGSNATDEPASGMGWWRSIERTWLCPTSEPVAVRLAMSGWLGDAPGALCDRCGTSVGIGEADEFGCASCMDHRVPWERAFRLGAYEDELRALILEVKFTRFRSAGTALGRMLGRVISEGGRAPGGVVVVPIPMSTRRRLVRGIDHTAAIGRGVAYELGAPMLMALARKHRPSQRTVSMSARARNVAGTIRLRRGVGGGLKGRTVVLVDDVRTSGATLRAGVRAIREGGAGCAPDAIWVATIGVTPGRGRKDLAGLARIRE